MKKRLNIFCLLITPILIIALGVCYQSQSIAVSAFDKPIQTLYSKNIINAKVNTNNVLSNHYIIEKDKKSKEDTDKMLKAKSTFVTENQDIMVYPGGQPIGVKLNTKGVLVVALSDIDGIKGKTQSPASNAGVEIGDSIIEINNIVINHAEDISRFVNKEKNPELTLKIQRRNGSKLFDIKVKPTIDSTDGKQKIGLWVRDSTAGVGTLTLYDSKTNKFAALGHPITDSDTGTILSINNGVIISSNIVSIKKGTKGTPGELRGLFIDENKIKGQLINNTECGIFGNGTKSLINNKFNKPMKIGLRNEIKEGEAQILTTINGNEPELFKIEIQKLLPQDIPGSKSMIIKITDPRLLEKTGGIVQGMSGSPIIQNNKIVGAVTHVLINKPDVGYGIYIEWMLKDAGILSK
ncbi:SpoIVB peptidase [Clostridium estertheticum]|uniref:SpoIVB peptidase n=1 Tax=Clostridium estertheticum TaxID=238834 RepID=A0AA47EL01_9CLOT|nr:SpoIVB peptidase [Clostridium estertheticum]MBU3155241.1 SpoIVB peptidase [Clostridium estertheticum]MBU3198634.1 SpoIVB peptidase [Clostridium estertheticum]WAG61294.1 SpoIVB peptidase [Clostridium estertheticum]WAG64610.1 SpoIVB peptidase [Clostridium estertheticum]